VKHRAVIVLTGLGFVVLAALLFAQVPEAAGNIDTVSYAPMACPDPAGNPVQEKQKHEYIGNKKCRMCHIKNFKSWEKTPHSKAFELLMPGKAADEKKKFKLDPDKDYTKDKTCLPCHVVGFEKKGGYAIPAPGDKKAARKAKRLEGVGCEACHGAGEEYAKVFKEIQRSKRKYKTEELYKVGLILPTVKTCTACHNEKSPTFDKNEKFDFEKMKKKGVHDHEPLKQREGQP